MSDAGDMIRRDLKDAGRFQSTVAWGMGISEKHLSQLILGRDRLSVQIAVRLEMEVPTISAEALLIAQVREEIRDCAKKINQEGGTNG